MTDEATAISNRLEQYVEDVLDGKAPPQIPEALIPSGIDRGVDRASFVVQRPEEIDPMTQWGTREAHEIDFDAILGSFPDPHVSYLVMPHFLAPFGSKMKITGEFPHSRYFSIQPTPAFQPTSYRYQAIGVGEVAYVDADIEPDAGSTNPFRVGADRNATNRRYTVTCDFAQGDPAQLDAEAWTPPHYRSPGNNHRHCSGLFYRGPWGDPNFKDANGNNSGDKRGFFDVGQMWVRMYAPDRNVDVFGGVPFPKVTYELPDGREYFINADFSGLQDRVNITRQMVEEPGRPPVDAWAGGYGWSKQISIFRQVVTGLVHENNYPNTNEADQQRYARELNLGVEGKGENAPGIMAQEPHATSSVHINYLTHGTCLPNGSVFTVQGRLPTTPRTRDAEPTMSGAEARYWSITGYSPKYDLNDPDYPAGAAVTSVMDDEMVLDANRNYTLMYGRAADRPANATAANNVTWVEWGPEACQSFTIRWMTIGPEWSFAKSPHFTSLGWNADWASASHDERLVARNNRRGFLAEYQPILNYLTTGQAAGLGNDLKPQSSDWALKQPATASTSCCGSNPGHATDGENATYWESNWWAHPSHLRVDLGATKSVDRVQIRWAPGGHATAYKVQTSSNGTTWTDVANRTGGTGGNEVVPFTPRNARYVRLLMTAGAGVSYKVNALEVWGR